jgi:hypothetical protein
MRTRTLGRELTASAQSHDVVLIPGSKRRQRREQNAAPEVRLGAAELGSLDVAFPPGSTAGDRYPDMSSVHRWSSRDLGRLTSDA